MATMAKIIVRLVSRDVDPSFSQRVDATMTEGSVGRIEGGPRIIVNVLSHEPENQS